MATLKKGTRITGTARHGLARDVRSEYLSGRSIRELAAEYQRSYGFIHRLLIESDVKLRGRGGNTRAKK